MAQPTPQKTIAFFVSAVLLGIVAAVAAGAYLKSREHAYLDSLKGENEQKVQVVVASQDLPRGLHITTDDLDKYFSIAEIPAKYVHANAVKPEDISKYVGRFIDTPLAAGKPLLPNFLTDTFPIDFSDVVTKGRRAMTVTVDEVTSISGLIRPGNHVDLFVNISTAASGYEAGGPNLNVALQQATQGGAGAQQAAGQLIAAVAGPQKPSNVILPLLQDVRVLATGQETYKETLDQLFYPQERTTHTFSTVTLDVNPEQAALLAIAEDKGSLIATLRNRDDRSAATFTGVTALDIYRHARTMQKAEAVRTAATAVQTAARDEAMRRAAAAAGATIDKDGNWVTADGRVIKKEDIVLTSDGKLQTRGGQVLAQSDDLKKIASSVPRIDKDGNLVTADGRVIKSDDVVVSKDGTITTKSGEVVMASAKLRAAAKAAGATIDKDGNWVTADGKVIKASDLVVSDNGTVTTKSGKVLAAKGIHLNDKGQYVDDQGKVIKPDDIVYNPDGSVTTKQALMKAKGYTVNANGDYVAPDGKVVPKEDVVVNPDGSVTTKDELMKAAGYTVDKDGNYVDSQGHVVKKDDVRMLANGTVMTRDGKVIKGPSVTRTKDGFLVAEDGTVMTADGKVLAGVTVDKNGNVVTADGRVLRDPNLTVAEDGSVRDRNGNVVQGVSGSRLPPGFAQPATGGEENQAQYITLIIGGSSSDGVAKVTALPVLPDKETFPSSNAAGAGQ